MARGSRIEVKVFCYIEDYCTGLHPENYRKEESFSFVRVHKSRDEYAWFIQHFTLLGTDGVIPCDKRAVPSTYWYINGKYYESKTVSVSTGDPTQFCIAQAPDLEREMTDPYLIERIEAAFLKEKNHA